MVAGKRVSPQDCARIRAYIDDTTNPRSNAEIANLMGVSTRTIERLRLNFELFDAPYPPRTAKVGRPMNLNEAQQAVRISCCLDCSD
jgi:transposase